MPEPLTLTVDDTVRRRMVVDLWRHNLRSLRTLRSAGTYQIAASAVVVLLLWHHVVGALVVACVLLLARLAWWWIQLTRNLSTRLPTGQVISVGHTPTGDLVVRDTDEVWLPRGSAMTVERIGSVTIVHGRAVTAVVPTVLLSDDDAAFLEGHADTLAPPQPASDEPLDLPLSVEISKQVQTDLILARRRSYLASGEFAMLVATPLLFFAIVVSLAKPQTTFIVMAVLSIPVVVGLNAMHRSCAALARTYPVGHTLRAGADEDGLVLDLVHGALRVHWADYQAHRLRDHTVELRSRKGRPLANTTLPLGLFTPRSLQLLTTAVPRRF